MDKMTRLFLVRHGETEWNKSLRYQGHRDIPLSDTGREQAKKIAMRLSKELIDAAYTSDLSRAVETGQIICGYHSKVKFNTLTELRETNFGQWEGLTYKEIDEQFHEVMRGWSKNPRETKIPGGESLGEVADRCRLALNQIISDNPEGNVLVVAHGGIIRIVIATVLGMDLNDYWKIKQDNVSLNVIEFYDLHKAILCVLNDTNHLGDFCISYKQT